MTKTRRPKRRSLDETAIRIQPMPAPTHPAAGLWQNGQPGEALRDFGHVSKSLLLVRRAATHWEYAIGCYNFRTRLFDVTGGRFAKFQPAWWAELGDPVKIAP